MPQTLAPLSPETLAGLRTGYQQDKEALFAAFAASGRKLRALRSVNTLWRKLTRLTDRMLTTLWRAHGLQRGGLLLAAVGGYGRAELSPYSDVDVLILLPDGLDLAGNPELKERVENFISCCWDTGLQIGSSVRTLQECIAESQADITIQTALLERRYITGSRKLFTQLSAACDSAMQPYAFYLAKTLEMRQRHAKYDNTPYSLEPNCKESPGGLRDLHVLLWVAKAAGYGNSWDSILQSGLLTDYEARQIKQTYAMLGMIRSQLHLVTRRHEDRLLFDVQTSVAEQLGYTTQSRTTRTGPDRNPIRPSEALMRHYYWTAKAVVQLSQILLLNIAERLRDSGHTYDYDPAPVTEAMRALQQRQQDKAAAAAAEEASPLQQQSVVNPVASTALTRLDYLPRQIDRPRRKINERFFDTDGLLDVATDDLYQRHPHAILETFLVLQREVGIQGLSARTLRALYNARALMDSRFRRDPVNRQQFLQILQAPSGVTQALRLMNQTSVLGRYLWVFRKIVGQMQHDLFHVYTVDQHILMVVRNVRRFFKAEHAHEYPLCSQLAAGWDAPWILSTAALFHDVAKGRGGDHSQLGEIEIRRFCKTHGIGKDDTELLAFLVREHLTMSQVSQKQDLNDPEVITRFARLVGSERYLTALNLLTVADIRGTSPKVWNAWKGKLLQQMYQSTQRVLGGHIPDADALVEARKREALIELARHSMPHNGHVKLWQTLDVRYFMRHESGDIAWHTRHLARHAGEGKTIVRARLSPHGEGLQVMVYTPDEPDLFARICSFFERGSFSILDARVHTTSDGCALDTFLMVTAIMPEHYREFITMVETSLTQTLEKREPLREPGRTRLSRRVKEFPITPYVKLAPDDKGQNWLLTINTSDRIGLLYRITRVLAANGIALELAKISTMGERVEDTFLIHAPELSSTRFQTELEHQLLEALDTN